MLPQKIGLHFFIPSSRNFLNAFANRAILVLRFFLIVNETAKMNGTKMVLSVKMHFCSKISMEAYNHQGFHFSLITLPIFRERRLQRRSLCISTNTNETFHEPVHVRLVPEHSRFTLFLFATKIAKSTAGKGRQLNVKIERVHLSQLAFYISELEGNFIATVFC